MFSRFFESQPCLVNSLTELMVNQRNDEIILFATRIAFYVVRKISFALSRYLTRCKKSEKEGNLKIVEGRE